jgi:hypothetical protein
LKGKPLNALALAQRLRQFGVSSKNVREGARVTKGYAAEDLADAWSRYLPSSRQKSATSATDESSFPGGGVADDAHGAATGAHESATPGQEASLDEDVDLCATCGTNPVAMLGLDCDACMEGDQ